MSAQASARTDKPRAARRPVDHSYRTFAGTICRGMDVLDANDRIIGQVARVESDHIVLVPTSETDRGEFFVPLSLIDGIHGDQVLLAGRGDASFGLGAQI